MANNMGKDNVCSLVLKLCIPSMIAQFINVLYSIVDRMFIGNIPVIGANALAGIGICGPIVTLISSFSSLVGIGGSPLMSISMGEKNKSLAKRILANCFIMLVVISLVLTVVLLIFKDKLLVFFGASENIFEYANTYMSVYISCCIFSIISMGMNSFIICQGFSKMAMLTVVAGAISNIILDPIFIFVLDMGVLGAAIATVLSQFISCVIVLWFLFSKNIPIRITFRGYNKNIIKNVLITGFSPFIIISLDSVIIIATNMVLQFYGGEYGDGLVACHTIAQSFFLMVTLPLAGITGSTQPILGYNYGCGDMKRVKYAQKYTLLVCVVFTSIMMVLAYTISPYFVRLFTNDSNYIELSVKIIKIFVIMIIPLSFQYVIVDGFTGISAVHYSIMLSCFRKFLYFVFIVVFPLFIGIQNVFFVEPVVDIISCIFSTIVYICVMNKILNKRLDTLKNKFS